MNITNFDAVNEKNADPPPYSENEIIIRLQDDSNNRALLYPRKHFAFGVAFLVVGCVLFLFGVVLNVLICLHVDNLVIGVLLIIAGSTSMKGSRSASRAVLITSMVLECVSSAMLFLSVVLNLYILVVSGFDPIKNILLATEVATVVVLATLLILHSVYLHKDIDRHN